MKSNFIYICFTFMMIGSQVFFLNSVSAGEEVAEEKTEVLDAVAMTAEVEASVEASTMTDGDITTDNNAVVDGKLIGVEYTLNVNGSVFDTNKDKTPLVFIQGKHHVLPKFEENIAGLSVGQSKQFSLSVTEGYGPVNQQALVEVPKEKIPADALHVGATLQTQSPDGRLYTGTLHEIKEGTVVLDFNHPLAGKNLDFEVKILSINDAPQQNQLSQELNVVQEPSVAQEQNITQE